MTRLGSAAGAIQEEENVIRLMKIQTLINCGLSLAPDDSFWLRFQIFLILLLWETDYYFKTALLYYTLLHILYTKGTSLTLTLCELFDSKIMTACVR